MHNPLIAVLCWYGLPVGLAFAPPPLVRARVGSSRRNTASACNLFSPDHGDHDGPIVRAPSKAAKAIAAGKEVSGKPSGGWGSWEKVVSQRVEQDEVLERFTSEGGVPEAAKLAVRTANSGDMPSISRLCIDTFRGPFQWFELPVQLFQEFAFFGQIKGRLGRVTRNEIKHGMVIAQDTTSRRVVGFLEIGMLPKPSSSEESALAGESLTAARAAAALAAAAEASGAKKKPDSERSSSTPPRAGETTTEDEAGGRPSEEEGGGRREGGREESSTTAIKREKQPEVAYLANVVVDRGQRRRGIGRTMVSSAIEIVRELWPAEENIYVSVEQARAGNDIALALYQGMGFELAALEDEMMARSRRRPPRVYLSKPLHE
ncbi:unnamed protein product [Ectocarpus fasciculatus]